MRELENPVDCESIFDEIKTRTPPQETLIMKENGFEARERLGQAYWDDPRWKKVENLRKKGKDPEANGLVFQIREDWGINY